MKQVSQDCEGFWVVFKTLGREHTRVWNRPSNAEDSPKDQQDVTVIS